ncbi:MAG: fibrobacter succinogenes major paralogous domain-containing protein [Bacteroidales bacterium]|nr:fibrobacter succinogenes major paralogous domain-containing protein [Bacteroidales bacterium]
MKKISLLFCAVLFLLAACEKEEPQPTPNNEDNGYTPTYPATAEVIYNAVTDIDGNHYDAVKIGAQVWMAANLRTTRYANGDAIPEGSNSDTIPLRFAVPQADNPYYGYLYNFYAVMHGEAPSGTNPSGVQGICPDGWHVPSDAEWTQLTSYCSGVSEFVCDSLGVNVAKALAAGYGWKSNDVECTVGNDLSNNNATGFSALPAGFYPGTQTSYGEYASFWSATESAEDFGSAYDRSLFYGHATVSRAVHHKYGGQSVRCVKD